MIFYLQVEAVNISHFIYDTQDLSTIRGGGLLLLAAIHQIEKRFAPQGLKAISTGASSGLFSCPTDLRQKIIIFLKNHDQFKHATFMVNSVAATDDFARDRETLVALTRWHQLQSPTVIYPELPLPTEKAVCEIDFVRPAVCELTKAGETLVVSEAVYQRRHYGLEEKQELYSQEIQKLKQSPIQPHQLPQFVTDFNELTEDEKRGNLNGKMAVIYLDGNSFGKTQQHMCKEGGEDALKQFDETVKEQRRLFLANFINKTMSTAEWTHHGKHRLEILLWGGDEMILVVPAWQGWWTLNNFFQFSRNWIVFDPDPNTRKKIQLTHAAGLVFCHHNAPIYRITHLAQQLAVLAKNKSRTENYFAYQVLESFDYTGDELETFRQRRCPQGVKQADFIISGNRMDKVLSVIGRVKQALPKGLIYRIVQGLLSPSEESQPLIEIAQNTLIENGYEESLGKLQECFGMDTTLWIHLIELLDYLE